MYKLQEVEYSSLNYLIQEAIDSKAFLPLKYDEDIFLESMKSIEGTQYFNFCSDDQAIGFAVILPYKEDGIMSIGPIYIKKDVQGQGLGTDLIKELISWAKETGLNGLFTKTWGENIRTRTIFERLGFEFIDEEPNDRVNGDSTVHYLLKW